ncbi:MAG: protoheme IX farnesyltransferase [Alphaproteobacteria bacterium]|nr:protoheme IX farnesyltransferase [Alphaproteobacteria bacterium]
MGSLLREVGSVFKLRIGLAITFSAMAGLAVTPGDLPPAWKIAVLALAVLLSSAAAGAFNQYVERDLDARMERTRRRPFVTGAFRVGALWPTIILLVLAVAVAMAVWALNVFVALYLFLGAFFYGVVYTVWLKQRSSLNIVLGGLSGSFAVLAGAAAVNPDLAPAPVILAIVLFLWTPPHFWSLATVLHRQYAEAGVPMLPVVIGDAAAARVTLYHTVALVTLSLVPFYFGLGWIYLAGAVLGGVYFVTKSIALVRDPGPAAAASNFRASLIQLSLLQLGAVVDRLALG